MLAILFRQVPASDIASLLAQGVFQQKLILQENVFIISKRIFLSPLGGGSLHRRGRLPG